MRTAFAIYESLEPELYRFWPDKNHVPEVIHIRHDGFITRTGNGHKYSLPELQRKYPNAQIESLPRAAEE